MPSSIALKRMFVRPAIQLRTDFPRCRRKDDAKPLSASVLPQSFTSVSEPSSPRSITPVAIPAGSPRSTTPVVRIPPDEHGFKSDLDPTEWKPKLVHRGRSEAYQYLAKFHAAMNRDEAMTCRPRFGHKFSSSIATFGTGRTPSLGNSPETTAASSFDSAYEFSTRPLLPRHNPMYALSGATKSADLVIPHIPPAIEIAISPPESDNSKWEKKAVKKGSTTKGDGLGALIHAAK